MLAFGHSIPLFTIAADQIDAYHTENISSVRPLHIQHHVEVMELVV
jgi:hypothetical protein